MPEASCPSCAKPGHSPSSKKFPASISKSPVHVSKGHWSVKGHSPTGTGKGTTECANEPKNDFLFHSREMGVPFAVPLFTGSNGKNSASLLLHRFMSMELISGYTQTSNSIWVRHESFQKLNSVGQFLPSILHQKLAGLMASLPPMQLNSKPQNLSVRSSLCCQDL